MSDTPDSKKDTERTKQVNAVCSTAGFVGFFALGCLMMNQSWPAALGVTAVMGMVAVVCLCVLKK